MTLIWSVHNLADEASNPIHMTLARAYMRTREKKDMEDRERKDPVYLAVKHRL